MRPTRADLDAALPHVLAAPKDGSAVEFLCFRPDFNARRFVEQLEFTRARGIPDERWGKFPWLRDASGAAHPGIQVSILSRRVLDLVWKQGEDTIHPGDTFVVDMDLSEANLPEGQFLAVGGTLLRVSSVFNEACVKWKARYGQDAKDWITAPGHPELRLRGVLCSIERDGWVKTGDLVRKITPEDAASLA